MDFLDYEEETEINESDSPHQSVTKLLDNRELLQELRATPSIASFLNKCIISPESRPHEGRRGRRRRRHC